MQVSDVQGPVLTICQSWPGGPRKPSLILTRGTRACHTETLDFAIWVEFRGFNAIFAIPWAKFDGFLVPNTKIKYFNAYINFWMSAYIQNVRYV